MKNYLVILFVFSISFVYAQKKPVKKGSVKEMHDDSQASLKNLNDSFSYAIGITMASFYDKQGVKDINPQLIQKAINDYRKNAALFSDEQANEVMMEKFNPKVSGNIRKGEEFLATNKNKPGVKTTASGLEYEVVTEGKGPRPGPTDTVIAHYRGTLLDGTEFDNSYKRNEPLTIELNHVIKGWTEALQLMPVGSKYKLYIPYKLAYGPNDNGPIPGGSVLVFEIELLGIKGKS